MIFDSSRNFPDQTEICNQILGPPISFQKQIETGSISSPPLKLVTYSKGFRDFVQHNQLPNQVEIFIRAKGILVQLAFPQGSVFWAIPFYKLHIYQSHNLSIHADGHFLQFKKTHHKPHAQAFFKRLHQKKVDHLPPGSSYYDY